MMSYSRTSTFSVSAARRAVSLIRVLNPTTIAFEAEASRMSLSLISPAPSWRMLIFTSSVASWPRAWVIAPSEPETSVLRMIRSSLACPAWICRYRSSSVARPLPSPLFAAIWAVRASPTVLLDHDAGLSQLRLHPLRIGVRLVHLVEGDDDRHLCRLGMADRLKRLGDHAVLRGPRH